MLLHSTLRRVVNTLANIWHIVLCHMARPQKHALHTEHALSRCMQCRTSWNKNSCTCCATKSLLLNCCLTHPTCVSSQLRQVENKHVLFSIQQQELNVTGVGTWPAQRQNIRHASRWQREDTASSCRNDAEQIRLTQSGCSCQTDHQHMCTWLTSQ